MEAKREISFTESQNYIDKSCMLKLFLTKEEILSLKADSNIIEASFGGKILFSSTKELLDAIIKEAEK